MMCWLWSRGGSEGYILDQIASSISTMLHEMLSRQRVSWTWTRVLGKLERRHTRAGDDDTRNYTGVSLPRKPDLAA